MKTVKRRGALLVGVAAAVVALDQWTKSWAQGALAGGPVHVLGPVNLGLVYNKGAAFSFGTGASPVIAAVAVALVLAVVFYSRRVAKGGAPVTVMVALADRFFRHHHGGVVDFIQLVSWWATFNVADAAVTVGALTLAVSLVLSPGGRRASGPARSSARSSTAVPPMSTRASRAPSGTSTAPGGEP
jgi:signal peptidase II